MAQDPTTHLGTVASSASAWGISRRSWLVGVGAAAAALLPRSARADDVVVPVQIQMKLLVKVAAYDKNLPKRAGDRARILISSKPNDADAERVAAQAVAALADHEDILGLPIEVISEKFSGAVDLKKSIARHRLAIVYFTAGFSNDDVQAVAATLDRVDILTSIATPRSVQRGVVLGFDLVSSKPKLLVHLSQAKKQNVAFAADVLKLATIYE